MWLKDQHVHIVGLGLMGASMAMALHGKVRHLSGSDIKEDVQQSALQDKIVEKIGGMEDADIIVFSIPAHYIGHAMTETQFKPGVVITDMGSTKSRICYKMDQLPKEFFAVGGHPMCGLAENGYHNAIPTLYAGARYILCETKRTSDTARTLMEQLVGAIGAIPLWMDRHHHDQTAGAISHLPHLMSFALMRMAMELSHENGSVWEMAAGGFDGATRLARTDEPMISGMFRTNANQLRQLSKLLQKHLDDLTALLDDPDALRQELNSIVEARRDYTQHYGERMIT